MPEQLNAVEQLESLKMEFNRKIPQDCLNILGHRFISIQEPYTNDTSYLWSSAKLSLNEQIDRAEAEKRITAAEMVDDADKDSNQKSKKIFKDLVCGKTFVDLGCGDPDISVVPHIVAKKAKAKRYIGVDLHPEKQENRVRIENDSDSFISVYIKDDLLKALASYQTTGGNVFFVSGLENDARFIYTADEYAKLLIRELTRLTAKGDAVMLFESDLKYLISEFEKNSFKLKDEKDVLDRMKILVKQ